MIEIEHISKTFGRKTALCDVNLSFDHGAYGLLGSNGAGKTTLMRIVATVLRADEGCVRIDGAQLTNEEARKRIGYLPQQFSMYRRLSVEDSLQHIALLKGIKKSEIQAEITRVIDAVNLSERRKSKFGELPGGMKRRVGIAQALIGNPRLLIVDEPTAGLDPEERLRFRDLLSDISQERMTLISTHIVEDAEAVCDCVGVLREGRILMQGSQTDLIHLVQGKVWEMTSERKVDETLNRMIVTQKKTNAGYSCRLISEQPTDGAERVEETLEDAYIYLNRKA